jgi:hypothetical protein
MKYDMLNEQREKSKKYDTNAPQLHAIWPQVAWGAHSPIVRSQLQQVRQPCLERDKQERQAIQGFAQVASPVRILEVL